MRTIIFPVKYLHIYSTRTKICDISWNSSVSILQTSHPTGFDGISLMPDRHVFFHSLPIRFIILSTGSCACIKGCVTRWGLNKAMNNDICTRPLANQQWVQEASNLLSEPWYGSYNIRETDYGPRSQPLLISPYWLRLSRNTHRDTIIWWFLLLVIVVQGWMYWCKNFQPLAFLLTLINFNPLIPAYP